KAQDIGLSLLVPPLFAFSVTTILMLVISNLTKKTAHGSSLFTAPKKNAPPPIWIRALLILTCTSGSFADGANDGEKGVGLSMPIRVGVIPSYFALQSDANPSARVEPPGQALAIMNTVDDTPFSASARARLGNAKLLNQRLVERVDGITT